MKSKEFWWQNQDSFFFSEVFANINQAMVISNSVDKATKLFLALNRTWNSYPNNKEYTNLNDSRGFSNLIKGLGDNNISKILVSQELIKIINLRPKVMNHQTLREANYDPSAISPDLQQAAQVLHIRLENEYHRLMKQPGNINQRERFLDSLAKFLYMIRSNIMHGEKTPRGPDHSKVQRDRDICRIIYPFLLHLLEGIFDFPSTRLAVYGSLAPRQTNSIILENINGTWTKVFIHGDFFEQDSFKYFSWNINGQSVSISMLSSGKLAEYFEQLDKFEGSDYQRVWVPVEDEFGKIFIANIYAASEEWD